MPNAFNTEQKRHPSHLDETRGDAGDSSNGARGKEGVYP